MLLDMHNDVEARIGMNLTRQTNSDAAIVGAIIDTANFETLTYLIVTGAITDANVTTTVLVEDGNNSSLTDNAAVDDAFLIGTETGAAFTFANDNIVRKISYIGPKRYVRMTITPSGNDSGNVDVAVVALLGKPRKYPKSTQ